MTFTANFHLSDGYLAALRSQKGKRWRLATGKPAPEKPGHHFSWDDVIVATDAGEVRIHTELTESNFEGYSEEYGQLSVHRDSEGLAKAQREGNVYFQHAGEQITEVYVVRITISQSMHGEPTWTYSSDCGVIFRLT